MSVQRSLEALRGRIAMSIGRVVLRESDDDKLMQEVQIEGLEEETHDGVEHLQPYGFAARPKKGAEGVMLSIGGLRGHGVVINVADRRYRLKGLEEGEAALFDDLGQVVHLTRDGIRIFSEQGITIETEGDLALSADGNVSIEAGGTFGVTSEGAATIDAASLTADTDGAMAFNSDNIGIGNGASLAAARNTDPINDSIDKISGGSSKVRIA